MVKTRLWQNLVNLVNDLVMVKNLRTVNEYGKTINQILTELFTALMITVVYIAVLGRIMS